MLSFFVNSLDKTIVWLHVRTISLIISDDSQNSLTRFVNPKILELSFFVINYLKEICIPFNINNKQINEIAKLNIHYERDTQKS